MIPKTLSASAVHVAELCLARYKAQYIDRVPTIQHFSAATLGSCCHTALENFVVICVVNKEQEPTLLVLKTLFQIAWQEYFGPIDAKHQFYIDGMDMMENWFKLMAPRLFRNTVISTEEKRTFDLPTKAGIIPFTYIIDRLDVWPNGTTYEVIDYKSQRWAVNPDDLKLKIQPRAYALAIAIQLKAEQVAYDKIWVRFDLLRHDSVAVPFNRTEITETFNYLIDIANKIIDTDPNNVPETLNSECMYCPIKASCSKLTANIAGGGIFTLSIENMIDKRAQLEWQQKAQKSLIDELDEQITEHAKSEDVMEIKTDETRLSFAISKRRTVDGERVEKVIGEDKFAMYGKKDITMAQFDKLLKDPAVDPAIRKELATLVGVTYGEPKVKVEARSFEDD